MRLLNGSEIAGFIKLRQARQARAMKQSGGSPPKLAIVQTRDDPAINKYVSLKKAYGRDIAAETALYKTKQNEAAALLDELNRDQLVHGVIVQLPLARPEETDRLVNLIAPAKDVDGLGSGSLWPPATPTAINWLLAGYNVELRGVKILIIGQGRLVGAPLAKLWRQSGLNVTTADETTADLKSLSLAADVVVSAAGRPGLVKPGMLSPGTIVVDAGTASENGRLAGDVDPAVYQRHDLTLTPRLGGVGPLTIAALFDNLLRAASRAIK